MSAIELCDLSIGYRGPRGSVTVVGSNLSLSLQAGELVCLLGPNGAGKSTLLRTLAGVQEPLAGLVLLNGADIARMSRQDIARQLSVVLTERIAVGMLTAYELVATGRHPHTNWRGTLTARDHEVIRRVIEAVRAEDLIGRQVLELSDGERQRIMIARALAQEPRVMILDEITAFLDLPRRVEMMKLLSGIASGNGCSILLSTHDLELAMRNADRIWVYPRGGPVRAGLPEELAWSGALDQAFQSEGVRFDQLTGSFQLGEEPTEKISVVGAGLHAHWTIKALERRGWKVVSDHDHSVRVEVYVQDGLPQWILQKTGERQHHRSLDSLLRSV